LNFFDQPLSCHLNSDTDLTSFLYAFSARANLHPWFTFFEPGIAKVKAIDSFKLRMACTTEGRLYRPCDLHALN